MKILTRDNDVYKKFILHTQTPMKIFLSTFCFLLFQNYGQEEKKLLLLLLLLLNNKIKLRLS